MKNNMSNTGNMDDGEGMDLAAFLNAAKAIGPKFRPMQKVWLRCGDMCGMVVAVITYADRYTYAVRWADGTKDELLDYELTDAKAWE